MGIRAGSEAGREGVWRWGDKGVAVLPEDGT